MYIHQVIFVCIYGCRFALAGYRARSEAVRGEVELVKRYQRKFNDCLALRQYCSLLHCSDCTSFSTATRLGSAGMTW